MSLLSLRYSRYAAQRYAAHPYLANHLDFTQPWSIERLQQRLASLLLAGSSINDSEEEATLFHALRQLRQEVMLTVMERDLRGQAALSEVTHSMTWLAEVTIQRALQWATTTLAAKYGVPRDADGQALDLLVVGMGKLGGRELNVSSDIDLIFIYPDEGTTCYDRTCQNPSDTRDMPRNTLSNHEFFERVGRKLIQLLAAPTTQGMVFRVDMRLRPYGDSGALVCSLSMLENYFITQAREWERYAWLKARVVSQPVVLQHQPAQWQTHLAQLTEQIRPFVYRRYLDFGAIEALRDLHGKIKQDLGRRTHQHQRLHNHHTQDADDDHLNIKLGRGGIREIEFIAQVFQLIRGGRDTALRVRSTQAALQLCADRGYLDDILAEGLLAAYQFLRRLEHCLQYRDDAQTHTLPADPSQQAELAAMMGMDHDSWHETLCQHRVLVMQQFDRAFRVPASSVPPNPERSDETNEIAILQKIEQKFGADDTAQIQQYLDSARRGGKYLGLAEHHRQRFERLIIPALQHCLASHTPVVTLRRVLDLLDTIGRRGAYLSLLCEYPHAFARLVRLLNSSQWAATYLLRHPLLLDELVDRRDSQTPPDLHAFDIELRHVLAQHTHDTEQQMNLMREAHHAQVFRLLLRDLDGLLSIEKLADYLSELADRILRITLDCVWAQLRRGVQASDTWPQDPRFAIIAYGKLGGKELGYASDLDLIFLFDDPDPDAQERYALLARRITSWLSSQTTAGILFEIDLRLRPNGNAGLLVSSLEAFIRYQKQSAWVWEHQALTRARFCAGDPTIGQAFEAARCDILQQPRDPADLAQEVVNMREKMHAGHRNSTALFDLKHDPGGMVDIEFCVQYLVLAHSAHIPALTRNLGNIALLSMCSEANLIPPTMAQHVSATYRHFRALQHQLRLNGATCARVEHDTIGNSRNEILALWRYLFGGGTPSKRLN